MTNKKKIEEKKENWFEFKLIMIQIAIGLIAGILISAPIALIFTLIVILYNVTKKGKTTFDKWCITIFEEIKNGRFFKTFQ